VDRTIGRLVWTETAPKHSYLPAEPRLLIDSQRLMAMVGAQTSPRLEIVPLSAETLAAGRELVASGATAKDVGLPPLAIADWSAVKNIVLE